MNIFHQRLGSSFRSPMTHCPCGCDTVLDANGEAHAGASTFSLINGGCDGVGKDNGGVVAKGFSKKSENA